MAASHRKCSKQTKPKIFPEAHYGFITALNETLAVTHCKLQTNEKLFNMFFTPELLESTTCEPLIYATCANQFRSLAPVRYVQEL